MYEVLTVTIATGTLLAEPAALQAAPEHALSCGYVRIYEFLRLFAVPPAHATLRRSAPSAWRISWIRRPRSR